MQYERSLLAIRRTAKHVFVLALHPDDNPYAYMKASEQLQSVLEGEAHPKRDMRLIEKYPEVLLLWM